MKVLFLTLGAFKDIEKPGLYSDLLRQFRNHGDEVYVLTPLSQGTGNVTYCENGDNVHVLRVKIGNIDSSNLIKKGIATVTIEHLYKSALKKHFGNIKFDLILYSTPPVTLASVVAFVKKRDGARSYLLLKDIFPQNAVDLGMMTTTGPKSVIYKLFRKKEKQLYAVSDTIGCMSQANVDYVLKHNPEIASEKVEICPNCIEVQDVSVTPEQRENIRKRYGIPLDKKVFVYGGNLGKPQGVPFLIDCLRSQSSNSEAFFLVVGDGTEFYQLQSFLDQEHPSNMKLLKQLPKADYDQMIAACDVGMIFLDHRFTIPNFPSRLLAYMQAYLPVLSCTDPNTDVGEVIEQGDFGWCVTDNSTESFADKVMQACKADCIHLGRNANAYLEKYYTSAIGYRTIMH